MQLPLLGSSLCDPDKHVFFGFFWNSVLVELVDTREGATKTLGKPAKIGESDPPFFGIFIRVISVKVFPSPQVLCRGGLHGEGAPAKRNKFRQF